MTDLVDPKTIESKVGAPRHPTHHLGRAVTVEKQVYVLHSQQCRDSEVDLRDCPFSIALDQGIFEEDWAGHEDRPVVLAIDGLLVPACEPVVSE